MQIDLEETLLKTEQYLCPANRNHKLQSLDKLLSHLHTCKEVKLPDKQRYIYYCQYYQGHCFLSFEERQSHESICQWKNVPGKEFDPSANKYSIIQPSGKQVASSPQKVTNYSDSQQKNYEYALKKGLIKKKAYEEYIPPNSFEFNKDYKKVDEQIRLQIQKNIADNNQSFIQFTFKSDFIMVQPQNKQFIEFIIKRLPYNQHFRKQKYYDDSYKNQIVQELLRKEQLENKYDFSISIPNEAILDKLNFQSYPDYLKFQYDEFVCCKKVDIQEVETQTYVIINNNHMKFFIRVGRDFNDIFGKNLMLLEYKAVFADFLSFKFDRDEYLDNQIKEYLSQNVKQETNSNGKKQQNIFEEEIDIVEQKQIGELKAKLEIQKQKNQEYQCQLEKNQRELKDLIDKKQSLMLKEQDVEQQIKKVNAQINSYNSKIKSYKQELELKNQEKIKILYDQKENELTEFVKDLNKSVMQYENTQSIIREEVQNLKEEKQKLKSNINRLQPYKQQLERQLLDLQRQESSVPQQMTQSEYYTGNEFIFDISDKIKCKACKQRKINVVYIPCGDAALCRVCHEKFEQLIPHVCPVCEKQVKRIYHFVWENER